MEKTEEMKEICEALDQLVIRFFETLDTLSSQRIQLEEAIREGYFNMSKARYSMGNKSVGALQFNENKMKALYGVEVNDSPADVPSTTFSLVEMRHNEPDIKSNGVEDEDGLRLRKVQNKNMSNEETVETLTANMEDMNIKENNTEKTPSTNKDKVMDPIKWFGVLVPSTLRHSQGYFRKAMGLSCSMATLQTELIFIKKDYHSLMRKKQELAVVS